MMLSQYCWSINVRRETVKSLKLRLFIAIVVNGAGKQKIEIEIRFTDTSKEAKEKL